MGLVKFIKLTQGKYAIVDEAKFEYLNQWRWQYAKQGGYAVRAGQYGVKQMHRILLNCRENEFTDHLDGDGTDNRMENLRICSKSTNGMNRGKQANNTSGYKGVVWNKKLNKWVAQIGAKAVKKTIHLGVFLNKEDAAHAYDEAAKKLHGKFARLNFKEEKCES